MTPPPSAISGSLTLSRGGDYNVTAEWSFSKACARNPRIRADASGSTADLFDLTGTSGSESLSTAKYRNVAATVELRCDGVVLATETIVAPTGSLTLTRGTGNSLKVAWTLNPSCAAGKVTTSPAGETQTHDSAISGTSGNVETTDSAYTTKGADAKLECNDAEIAKATIAAPLPTGSLTLSRSFHNYVAAQWTLSHACRALGQIVGVAANDGFTVTLALNDDTSGTAAFTTGFETHAVEVTLRCDGTTLATKTIAAPS